MNEPWREILEQARSDGVAFTAEDRDEVACMECGGRPHAHRPLCSTLRVPVHADDVGTPRESTMAWWRFWTGGLRPMWIHHGQLFDEGTREHVVDEGTVMCWCRPEIIEPERRIGLG